ncbi:MAG: hypothetical protein IK120_05025 [Muribaculaceae bacterium]|nr:hypothetical protein [Muribaculaceae bacterium]
MYGAGYQQPYVPQQVIVNAPQSRTNGVGIAGFVISLLAGLLSWTVFIGFILWLLGLIFSIVGMGKRPRGLAIAGLIISLLSLLGFLMLGGLLLL